MMSPESDYEQSINQFNEALKNPDLQTEFRNTVHYLVVRAAPQEDLEPLEYKRITQVQLAILDPNTGDVYLGDINSSHPEIARDSGVMENEYTLKTGPRGMYSSYVFDFLDSPSRVFFLDTIYQLNTADVEALKKLGYIVLDPEYRFIDVEKTIRGKKLKFKPSPMTR